MDDGAVILTVTSFMTEVYGRFPIDIYLLSDEGDVIGSFSLVLNVARAAVKNGKIATLTYKQALEIILDWAVEVPTYQRQNALIFSTENVNLDTLTPDITTFWGWAQDIELLEVN